MFSFSKRELAAGAWLVLRCASGALFVGTFVCAVLWAMNPEKFAQKMEPWIVLSGLLLAALSWGSSKLLDRVRKESDSTKDSEADKRLHEWTSIRGALIQTVRKVWIDDYLSHSLVKNIRIRLGAVKTPDAFDHGFCIERRSTAKIERLTEKALLRLFDESGRSLLIQGNPGSGKTFTLLQLAEQLLDRAEENAQAPVPVVVPLASWAADQKPLEEWLAREMLHRFRLDARITPVLLVEGRLILMLDGLDEVRESARPKCLTAIQTFLEKHTTTDVVLCCRAVEYQNLPSRLSHGEAIRVLPLTPEQIDQYFDKFPSSTRLDALRQRVKTDTHWGDLATTPLLLNIMAAVYLVEDALPGPLPEGKAARDDLFFHYVREMFTRKERLDTGGQSIAEDTVFSKAHAIHWLQQLSQGMVQQQLTSFYIERLQPSWVRSRWRRALGFGLAGAVFGAMFGGVSAFFVGLQSVIPFVCFSAIAFGILFAIAFGIIVAPKKWSVFIVDSVEISLNLKRIKFALRTEFFPGIVGSLVVLLIAYLSIGFRSWQLNTMFGGVFIVLIASLSVALFEPRVQPYPTRPNQGVYNSLKIGLSAAIGLCLAGSIIGLSVGQNYLLGTSGWSIGIARFGGMSGLFHYAIRLALAWEGTLPFPLRDKKLISFLDSMRDRLLLTRVGGGWMFIHRELLEFLAKEPFGANPAEIEQTLRRGSPAHLHPPSKSTG